MPTKPLSTARTDPRAFNTSSCAPGFGPGTLIATQDGELPVEWLETGDMLVTRDHGYQPIVWIGRSRLTSSHLRRNPQDLPLCLPAGSVAPNSPSHDLIVSGAQPLLVNGAAVEVHFAESEVLAPANVWLKAGAAQCQDAARDMTLVHIMCESQQLILAQGAWVATKLPGPEAMPHLDLQSKRRLQASGMNAVSSHLSARTQLTEDEAVVVMPRRAGAQKAEITSVRRGMA